MRTSLCDVPPSSCGTASCSDRPLAPVAPQLSVPRLAAPRAFRGQRRRAVARQRCCRAQRTQDRGPVACAASRGDSCTCGACESSGGAREASAWRGLRAPAVSLLSGTALTQALDALLPRASAAAEALPLDLLSAFLDSVESLGVYGPLVFVATMVGAEMVPLFPTQPLTIASGLLFGASKGAVLALVATSAAAVLAFQLSRRVGRRIAERWVAGELGEEERAGGMFARVQAAVDSGSFWQQLVAVMLLRLTPVVPFSASNYLLGATPLKFSAYLVGSIAGLSLWSAVFASLGGAGRELLESGLSLDVLYGDLLAQASGYTSSVAAAALVLAAIALLFFKFGPQASPDSK